MPCIYRVATPWSRLLSGLGLIFLASQVSTLAAEQKSNSQPWSLTNQERGARRTQLLGEKARDLKSTESKDVPQVTIYGSVSPELIYPGELLRRLIRTTVTYEDQGAVAQLRKSFETRASVFGITLPDNFWDRLALASAPLVDVYRRSTKMEKAYASAKAGIETDQIGALSKEIIDARCTATGRSLASARKEFGPVLDQLLYRLVAPDMFVTIVGDEKGGCHE